MDEIKLPRESYKEGELGRIVEIAGQITALEAMCALLFYEMPVEKQEKILRSLDHNSLQDPKQLSSEKTITFTQAISERRCTVIHELAERLRKLKSRP